MWLLEGRLAGTPQPGVVADIESDLQALRRVGVTDLDNSRSDPIADMGIYLDNFSDLVAAGAAVIGVGRTETHPDPGLDRYDEALAARGLMLPVFEVDVRRREDVLMLLDMLFGALEATAEQ